MVNCLHERVLAYTEDGQRFHACRDCGRVILGMWTCTDCEMLCLYQPPMTEEERIEHHRRLVHSKCEACRGAGWLLMDNSDHGLRIERCDACEMFGSDDEAVTYVAETLLAVEKVMVRK